MDWEDSLEELAELSLGVDLAPEEELTEDDPPPEPEPLEVVELIATTGYSRKEPFTSSLNYPPMQKRKFIPLAFLVVAIALGFFFSSSPPAAKPQKLIHSGLSETDHWTVDVNLQEYRTVAGGSPTPQPYDRKAHLKARIITQENTGRFESIEKTEYSWKRIETRATLLNFWDTVVGPNGGLKSLKVRAASSSPWFQTEVLGPLNAALWPELPDKEIRPGDSWDSTVPLQIEARELAKPLAMEWKCHWTWRPPVPGSSEAVATLDLQATPSPMQGSWSGEVLYSVPDRRVVGARGLVKLSYTAPTGQPELNLISASEFSYELLRWLPGSTGKTPPANPPGAPEQSASPAPQSQTP